jgi:ubiquinone biosynthesis protein
VITAEHVRGIALSELLEAVRSGDAAALERIGASDLNLERLAETVIVASLTQIFRFRFFHADVHPGNLFALPGGRVGYVDFGLCDELDETVRERQARYLAALYERNLDAMYTALTELLVPSGDADLGAFRTEFVRQTRLLLAGDSSDSGVRADRALDERSPIAVWLVAILRAARAHGLRLPPRILSLYRTLLTVETVARGLAPTADLRTVGQDFFSTLRVAEVLGEFTQEDIQALALTAVELLHDGPERLQELLERADDGTLAISAGVAPDTESRRGRRHRARLSGTALVGVGIAALLASSGMPELVGVSLAWPLGSILVLVSALIGADAWRLR